MLAPIILIDGGDVQMFQTKEQAENWLEPWAIEDGCVGFDATARPLNFFLSSGAIRITCCDEDPQNQQVVSESLRQYLVAVGVGEHLVRDSDLRTLVAMASQYAM